MSGYHITPDKIHGQSRRLRCVAEAGNCKYGDAPHFETKAAADDFLKLRGEMEQTAREARRAARRASQKPVKVDLSTPAYDKLFEAAATYQKTARVQARQATEPTPISTILADGTFETQNIAQPGDYIITNPGGEEYIISAEKFEKRYRTTDTPGTFQAVGEIQAIKNPTGKPITIIAPWGEEQHGGADCILASALDNPADRYIIGATEFVDTYAIKV
jgi:hypothetical protein